MDGDRIEWIKNKRSRIGSYLFRLFLGGISWFSWLEVVLGFRFRDYDGSLFFQREVVSVLYDRESFLEVEGLEHFRDLLFQREGARVADGASESSTAISIP